MVARDPLGTDGRRTTPPRTRRTRALSLRRSTAAIAEFTLAGMRRALPAVALGSFAALLSALVIAVGAAEPPRSRPGPSVLLVTLDTTRADHLGCYGAPFASTPNLDALAREGARFDFALAPTPLTLPSHCSLMTGLVPRRHGVRDNARFRLPPGIPVLAERLRAAGYRTAAYVSSAVLDRIGGLDRGFDLYDDTVRAGDRRAFNYEERAANQTTGAALRGLARLEPPFFLWVHYFDPHLPYVPPDPFRARFSDRPYDGEIAFTDSELGRLLEAARRRAPSLLVVVAGDHGESLGDHGEAAHGVFLYQATQRVPLLLAGPAVPRGAVIREGPVGLVDVAPTILDLLGLPPIEGGDGRSLAPLLRGGGGKVRQRDIEMETFYPSFAYGWAPLRGLVRGRLKYIEAPRPELYDLATDPAELRNEIEHRGEEARALARAIASLASGDEPRPPTSDPASAERRARLESLGYVAGGGAGARPGPDPKEAIGWLADLDAGRRAIQAGRSAEGIAPLERLLARNPENVPALLALGQCRLATGDPGLALEAFERAARLDPDNPLPHFHRGNAFAEKARETPSFEADARSAYERALALHPRHAETYLNYAALLARGKDGLAAALGLLLRARAAGVEDPDVETEIGLIELARGDRPLARAAFERAISLDPRQSRALESLGRIAYEEGDFPRAAGFYERALEGSPRADLARTLGAIRLVHLQDLPGARRAFERALELMPSGDPEREAVEEVLAGLESTAAPSAPP